jgi:outer membrane biosynthesis protein TonB
MFGFIKNLFGGIMAFIGGIFGGSKKSKADDAVAPKAKKGSNGFYMELSDAGSAAPIKAAPKPEAVPAAAAPEPKAKSAKKAKSEPKPEPAKEPTPVAAPAANMNGKVKPQPKPVVNFATDYLISMSSTNGRRRPGANMNSFLEMARQMK